MWPEPSIRDRVLLPLALLTLLPYAVAGQATIEGVVWDGVRSIPLDGARVTIPGLERVAVTDEQGVYRLSEVPVGTYELTLDHEWLDALAFQPAAIPVTVEETDSVIRRDLVIPPLATLVSSRCAGANDAERMTLAGFVRDPVTEVQLPAVSVRVTVSAGAGRGDYELEATTGLDGLYVVCGIPVGRPVEVVASLGDRSTEPLRTTFAAPGAVQLDLPLPVASGAFTAGTAPARRQGEGEPVYGTLRDRTSGEPIEGAEIVLSGSEDWRAVSDHRGRFRLLEVPPGTHTLRVERLGYRASETEVQVEPGVVAAVDIELAVQAVELDPIEVTVREATVEEVALHRVGTRSRVLVMEDIRERAGTAVHTGQVVRRLPGVYVREVLERGIPRICVEGTRGTLGGGCRQMSVYIDGIRAEPASDALMSLPPAQIESIEVFTPATSALSGVMTAGRATDILVIYTRGNGPYAKVGKQER